MISFYLKTWSCYRLPTSELLNLHWNKINCPTSHRQNSKNCSSSKSFNSRIFTPRRLSFKSSQALTLSNDNSSQWSSNSLIQNDFSTKIDTETCRLLCLKIQQHVPHAASFFLSDETHFYLCGAVNKQNFRYWTEKYNRQLHERLYSCLWVTLGCAVAEFSIWGLKKTFYWL